MESVSRTVTPGGEGIVPLVAGAASPLPLGAKAVNLARAHVAGLPVVDGFVIAPALASLVAGTERPCTPAAAAKLDELRYAWAELSRNGSDPVVVRSSSVAEDTAASSQAGVFESVVDVRGWDAFLDAIATVAASAARSGNGAEPAPLAVLVQRHIDPAQAGVMFGVDPVSGRSDRLVVAVVSGGPQALVSGEESGTRLAIDRHGRLVEGDRQEQPLGLRTRRALAGLASRVEALFGGPQDVEWALTHDGSLLLLQSRPVTATGAVGTGPVLGPGPVAETFPDPLRRLEQDLWITPLRDALRVVLHLTGRASRRQLDRSPIATVVGGRPAVDLDLFEAGTVRRRGLALFDPRQPARRLKVAWRVGRLRAGLPALSARVVADLDRHLAEVPPLDELADDELTSLLVRARAALRSAHGYELLAGVLAGDGGTTAAEVALTELAAGRRLGRSDGEIVAGAPAVLALVPPAIGRTPALPPASSSRGDGSGRGSAALGHREALRLRIRWLHELSARAALQLGGRLVERGQLDDAMDVADLTFDGLVRAVSTHVRPDPDLSLAGPPLPARFQLAADGAVVALRADAPGAGTGAGGGRGVGRVDQGREPMPGAVLVVSTLDPRLAPLLPSLAGLVAETGSPLSHLAILAREHGVPTVVGVADAVRRFPTGTELLVDGATGEVTELEAADSSLREVAP